MTIKYGFDEKDIIFKNGNLSLDKDPKEIWIENNPDFFPLNINKASKFDLLKVPGFGPTTVKRILDYRKKWGVLCSMDQINQMSRHRLTDFKYVSF